MKEGELTILRVGVMGMSQMEFEAKVKDGVYWQPKWLVIAGMTNGAINISAQVLIYISYS